MLKVGITGGIGSGKTTVARIFQLLGIPVYFADEAARRLMHTDPILIGQIKALLGEDAYLPDGTLNRKYVAQRVFQDKQLLEQLNAITHPATIRDAKNWMQKQQAPYVIKEAALLFETPAFHDLDRIIVVYAPLTLRLQRVMQRDQVSATEVQRRMHQQISPEIAIRLADEVIYNDEQKPVIPQVLRLHEYFLKQSSTKPS
ncbi:MAG: dephospho-CoA kinase [Thermoflavifilum aggregans]|nr:dephospho-CoA kinase [Thermoflavifilum aggregans]